MIGTRLGPYEITAMLGEGGMGLVFKAKDFQLGREVALKVLPEGFTQDPERLARFEREAKLLAQLNHPNIAQIYGFEASGETRALVMVPEPRLFPRRLARYHARLKWTQSLDTPFLAPVLAPRAAMRVDGPCYLHLKFLKRAGFANYTDDLAVLERWGIGVA